jgi:hypothetical protein
MLLMRTGGLMLHIPDEGRRGVLLHTPDEGRRPYAAYS